MSDTSQAAGRQINVLLAPAMPDARGNAFQGRSPYAAGLSVAIAVLRVVYGGGTRRQMFLEGALCGLITLALVPLLEWMGLPQGMATFAGGMVGFMGVEKLRGYSDLFLSRKAQG